MTPPSNMGSALEHIRSGGDLDPLLQMIPYARFLGLRLESTPGGVLVCMPGSEHLIGNPVLPALHGGTVGALLECTAIFQLLAEAPVAAVPKTINVTVDYLRSGRIVDTFARASITKHGRRVASVHVLGWQADEAKPIASAQAHFLLKNA